MVAAAQVGAEPMPKCHDSWLFDAVSKQIFESLVADEESHFDSFDKQLDNIKRFGPSYLALQSFESSIQKG